MKLFISTIAFAFAFMTTAAFADGLASSPFPMVRPVETITQGTRFALPVVGEISWDVGAERMGAELGTEFTYNSLTLRPLVVGHYNSVDSLAWDGFRFEVQYDLSRSAYLFGEITTDEFSYDNAVVGVRFNF